MQCLYVGPVLSTIGSTHPNLYACCIIWDSFESHHKLQHSPTYGPFYQALEPLLEEPVQIKHFKITDHEELKKGLEKPMTLIVEASIKKDQVAKFLETENDVRDSYLKEERNTLRMMSCLEDPYAPVENLADIDSRFMFSWDGIPCRSISIS